MNIVEIVLVLISPTLIMWDAVHDRLGNLTSYLILWLVCLTIDFFLIV